MPDPARSDTEYGRVEPEAGHRQASRPRRAESCATLPDCGAYAMDAENIVKLTPEAIQILLDSQAIKAEFKQPLGKRSQERWPFPGTVELWLPDQCYGEQHVLATLHNLSPNGLAMRTRRPIPSDTRVSLAIHLPALSCYGHGVVRHCTRAQVGYLVGAEFLYHADEEEGSEEDGS